MGPILSRKPRMMFTLLAGALGLSVSAAALAQSAVAGTELQMQWQELKSPTAPAARHENGFTAVGSKLFLIGGRGDRPLDIYDPASNSWTQGAKPPFEIHHMQGVEFDGKLYILGALTGPFPEESPLSHILIYDPKADSWSQGAEIPESRRRGASGVVVHDGQIYLVGGNRRGHMSGYVAWLDVFNPSTGEWQQLADAPHARDHFHAAVIAGKIYAAGGRHSAQDQGKPMALTVSQVDVYDIQAKQWQTLQQPLPTPRAGTATVAMDGKLLVLGGESVRQVAAHSEVEAYDPATGQWLSLQALPAGRHGTQAVMLNGALHISAGSGNRGGGPELTDHWVSGQKPASK